MYVGFLLERPFPRYRHGCPHEAGIAHRSAKTHVATEAPLCAETHSSFLTLRYTQKPLQFYNEAAASTAPAALKIPGLVTFTSTGYCHSMNFAHPVNTN